MSSGACTESGRVEAVAVIQTRGARHSALRAYVGCARAAVAVALQYRLGIAAQVAATLVSLLVVVQIWTAAYGGRASVDDIPLEDMKVYLTLANLQGALVAISVSQDIAERVRSGVVFFDVSRPVPYLGQMLALQVGQSLAVLGVTLVAAPIAALVGGLAPPASGPAALAYAVALLLGWLINALIGLLIGVAAFWAVDIGGFDMLYRLVSAFFAGTLVPLSFFPGPLRSVAEALPFRFYAYVPAAIYTGQIPSTDVPDLLFVAVLWVAGFGCLAGLVWRLAYRRVMVHGG